MYPHPTLSIIFDVINPARSGDTGRQWKGHCPAHDDAKMSLTVGLGDDDCIVFKCQAGCTQDAVRQAFGLSWRDLASPRVPYNKDKPCPRIYKPQPIRNPKRSESSLTPEKIQAIFTELDKDPDCVRGVARYAKHYGVSPQVLWDLGCRWKPIEIYPRNPLDPGELYSPERNGLGTVIGGGVRTWQGDKYFITGGHRGLIVLPGVLNRPGPIYLVEGLTDAAALLTAGACAIGRPSNTGGITYLAEYLSKADPDKEIIVIGENDRKPNGNWPGRSGAEQTARQLAELLKRPVRAALVPEPFKDTREWYQSPAASTGNPADACYRSLVFFADFPEKFQEVTEEELEVATLSAKAHSDYAHPEETCPRPGHMALRHLQRGNLRHTLNRCGSSACPNCFTRKKRLRWESLCRHYDALAIHPNAGLHTQTRTFTKKEWDTCRRTLIRRRCQFIRFRLPGDQFVLIATGEFSGSTPLSFADAPAFTKDAIDRAIVSGPGKPFFTSSKQWAMVREKPERQYQKIGNVRIPPQMVRRIAARLGIKYKIKRPADSSLLLVGDFEVIEDKTKEEEFIRLLTSKPNMSELYIYSMDDSDNSPPNEYFYRCLPKGIDTMFAWMMDPTG